MREFKFRAWNKADNEWWEGGGYVTFTFENMTSWEDWPRCCRFEDLVFMQYTGLKDKNGKEIYEGDVFRFYSPAFETTLIKAIEWPFDHTMLDCEGEVIGNIYENHDLLK